MNKRFHYGWLLVFGAALIIGVSIYMQWFLATTKTPQSSGASAPMSLSTSTPQKTDSLAESKTNEPEPCGPAEDALTTALTLLDKEDAHFPQTFFDSIQKTVFDVNKKTRTFQGQLYPIDCDDGSLAEGWSDLIEKLFVAHPSLLPPIYQFMKRDKQFRLFILRHIDGLWNANTIITAIEHVNQSCSADSRVVCDEIIAKMKKS
jgi:hypothetical protein